MATIKQFELIGTRLPGRHEKATVPSFYAWVRPMTQDVALLGAVSTDNSTGVSARKHRHR